MKYFKDLDLEILKNKKVILDIDGTISFDKSHEVGQPEKAKLEELKKYASEVILVSNGEHDRTKNIAEIHQVTSHLSEHKKPNKKVLHHFKNRDEDFKNQYIIVGDKFLTDGLLALQTGIPYLHVKSLISKNENFKNKLIFFIDDIVGNSFEFIKLIRPKQWIKNLLVLSPVFFAGKVLDIAMLQNVGLAFLAFVISASLVYIVNDFADIKNDQLHPKKRYRPLASGNIDYGFLVGAFAFLVLILVGILITVPNIFPFIVIYLVVNLLYTFKFKKVPVYDIVLVAFMYILRILVGGAATAIVISSWLTICMFFSALFITTAKRLSEIKNPSREVLKYYSKESLVSILVASSALALTTYSIYSILVVKSDYAIYSVVIAVTVFFVVLNDALLSHKKLESPEIYLMTNKKIIFLIVIWLIYEIITLYFI